MTQQTREALASNFWRTCDSLRRDNNCGGVMDYILKNGCRYEMMMPEGTLFCTGTFIDIQDFFGTNILVSETNRGDSVNSFITYQTAPLHRQPRMVGAV